MYLRGALKGLWKQPKRIQQLPAVFEFEKLVCQRAGQLLCNVLGRFESNESLESQQEREGPEHVFNQSQKVVVERMLKVLGFLNKVMEACDKEEFDLILQ